MTNVFWHPKLVVSLVLATLVLACSAEDPEVAANVDPSSGSPGGAGAGAGGPGAGTDARSALAATLDGALPSGPPAPVITIIDAGTAAAPDGATPSCAARKVEAPIMNVIQPADIIIAIDSSGSMKEEIAFVQTQMNAFSQQIVASGIDVRVILIGAAKAICIGAPLGSGSCPADSKRPGYLHVDRKVDSHDALNVVLASYPEWSPQLRPGASKSFVVITDDEATTAPNNTASAFSTNLMTLDAKMFAQWTFNGIFVLANCALGERVGQIYADLVKQTHGVSGDLCLQDFKPVFDRLSKQIITGATSELACEWDVPDAPNGEKLDFGSVNVRYFDKAGAAATLGKVPSQAECPNFKNGWYYDNEESPSKIFACAQSCTQMRSTGVSKVEVLLGCKSEPPPILN